jgi:phenylacetate-CoA ligase
VICGTPTYLLHLGEVAERMGRPLAESRIRTVVAAGEPGAQVPSTKEALEAYFGAECFDDIGSTESANWGFECVAHQGTHLIETLFLAECLNPVDLSPVPEGEIGELVLSNLCTESMPLIRYRIKDLVRFDTSPCACGRTFVRLDGGVIGRSDDMFQFAGVNIFPSGIENLIRKVGQFSNEYLIVVPAAGSKKHLRIVVEPASESLSPGEMEDAVKGFVEEFKYRIGVTPDVELKEAGGLPRSQGKAKRVIREE